MQRGSLGLKEFSEYLRIVKGGFYQVPTNLALDEKKVQIYFRTPSRGLSLQRWRRGIVTNCIAEDY